MGQTTILGKDLLDLFPFFFFNSLISYRNLFYYRSYIPLFIPYLSSLSGLP